MDVIVSEGTGHAFWAVLEGTVEERGGRGLGTERIRIRAEAVMEVLTSPEADLTRDGNLLLRFGY